MLIFKSLSLLLSIYEQWAHVFHTLSIFLLDTKLVLIVEFQGFTQLSLNKLMSSVALWFRRVEFWILNIEYFCCF